MIFDHFEGRLFIQNPEISDFTNFGGMGTGDWGPGTGDRDQGPGPGTRSKAAPLTFPRSLEIFEEMEKAKGGDL